jgi:hypothetical protein
LRPSKRARRFAGGRGARAGDRRGEEAPQEEEEDEALLESSSMGSSAAWPRAARGNGMSVAGQMRASGVESTRSSGAGMDVAKVAAPKPSLDEPE